MSSVVVLWCCLAAKPVPFVSTLSTPPHLRTSPPTVACQLSCSDHLLYSSVHRQYVSGAVCMCFIVASIHLLQCSWCSDDVSCQSTNYFDDSWFYNEHRNGRKVGDKFCYLKNPRVDKQQYCGTPCINLARSVCVHWSERCSYDVMNTEQFSCGQNNIKPAAVFIPSCLHDHCIVCREPGKK